MYGASLESVLGVAGVTKSTCTKNKTFIGDNYTYFLRRSNLLYLNKIICYPHFLVCNADTRILSVPCLSYGSLSITL